MLRKLLFCISGFAALIGAQVLAREAELSDFGQRSESLSWLQPDPEFIDPDHETIDVGRSMGELFGSCQVKSPRTNCDPSDRI